MIPAPKTFLARILFCIPLISALHGQEISPPNARPDLTKDPNLYVVGYAHLDTQWRWEFPQVIGEYLPKTMRNNFIFFEKYPHYIFNFSGSNRYRFMKEYYPEEFSKLKRYVAAGRWFPAGSSVEESDVNSPSAESIFRQILYGNEFFRKELGKTSAEYMLPDCFGFPASLPSILAHAGIKGFSTQKLTWGSSAPVGGPDSPERTPLGTPFNVGIWEGPDGRSVLAAFNPGSYSADITSDLSKPLPPGPPTKTEDPKEPQNSSFWRFQDDWARRVQRNGEVSGLSTDYHYYGTGDIGGAPTERSVQLLEAIITKDAAYLPSEAQPSSGATRAMRTRVGGGPVHVLSSTAEQMFLDINLNQFSRLPRYKGELELTNHSAGSLTSEAYQKRWNRKNELLADAAERASIAAEWLGGKPYPLDRLNKAWTLVLGGQFHDTMAGTATPKSYEYAWNDDVIAMNQFAGVLNSAADTVISAMDTQTLGMAIVVYNPLNVAREDVVEARVQFPEGIPKAVRVIGPDGKEVNAQLKQDLQGTTVLFLAKAPSVGWSVYDIQPTTLATSSSPLKVSESGLENARYRIQIDSNGDVSSLFDRVLNKELLSAPARLAFQTERPHDWPAWNMDWEDQQKPPRGFVQGPARIRIVEKGPVRVALDIERESEGSEFSQTIRLSTGDAGNRIEFANQVEWRTKEAALKATFPLIASNPVATYNWDVGTIKRTTNTPKRFEVASHQWFDLTDKSGAYGVTVLSDCKYGSDKPDDQTVRLTLIYTPGMGKGITYPDQATQDWGHHEFIYALASHTRDWAQDRTDWHAYRLNQPLIAFQTAKHGGKLGKEFSMLRLSNDRIRVLAMKKAEASDEVVVRLVELDGKPARQVHLAFPGPVTQAEELNGQEMRLGRAAVEQGQLVADFTPFQIHTFAIKVARTSKAMPAPQSEPVQLPYDTPVATLTGRPTEGCFDCPLNDSTAPQGNALPAEMLPRSLDYSGVHFTLAPGGEGAPNAVTAHGQTIDLPTGTFNRMYLLAASAHGDQDATFLVDDKPVKLKIQEWTGKIGQWDSRTWESRLEPLPLRPGAPEPKPGAPPRMRHVTEFTGRIIPGFIKRADLAWYASHRHASDGSNEPYSYSYLFAYGFDVAQGVKRLVFPDNPEIRVLALSVSNEAPHVSPAQSLYDTLPQR